MQLQQLGEVENKLILLTGFADKYKQGYNTHSKEWFWFFMTLQNYASKGHK